MTGWTASVLRSLIQSLLAEFGIKKLDNMRTSNIIKEGESILVNMKDKVFTIYAYVLWSR